jgi:hypothetical protein
VWVTAHKDESLLFATEACEDLDASTRWSKPSKVVQKTAPMELGNPIHVAGANLSHNRQKQCKPISRGQLRTDIVDEASETQKS